MVLMKNKGQKGEQIENVCHTISDDKFHPQSEYYKMLVIVSAH